MTKFRSDFRRPLASVLLIVLCGCASPSGTPAAAIPELAIADAYIALKGRVHLGIDKAVGAAMVVAPGIAATCAHNDSMVDPKSVIGTATLSDLMFFRVGRGTPPVVAAPAVGEAVRAYGEDLAEGLRVATGAVREIAMTPGYAGSPFFIFEGNAGPGFSGGPVLDASGRLVGITFGYKDEHGKRLIYAYDMARVMAELAGIEKPLPNGRN